MSNDVYKKYIKKKGGNYVMNYDSLAQYTTIKKNTLHIWVSQGRIPYAKLGRRTVFLRKEIDRWMKENSRKEKDIK